MLAFSIFNIYFLVFPFQVGVSSRRTISLLHHYSIETMTLYNDVLSFVISFLLFFMWQHSCDKAYTKLKHLKRLLTTAT